MRTQEEILAACERRFAEIEAEGERRSKDARRQRPCLACRFCGAGGRGLTGLSDWYCNEPLVVGYGKPPLIGTSWRSAFYGKNYRDDRGNKWAIPELCGAEKALWLPRLSFFQRILKCLGLGD